MSVILLPFPFDCIVSVRGFTIEEQISQPRGCKHGGVWEVNCSSFGKCSFTDTQRSELDFH